MTRPKGSKNNPKSSSPESPDNPESPNVKPDRSPRGHRSVGPVWKEAAAIEKTLTSTIESLGLGVGFINKIDGEIIGEGAPALAKALVDLATVDPRYRKMIAGASAPGKYGPLLMAIGGIGFPIMKNHAAIALAKKESAPKSDINLDDVVAAANLSTDIPERSSEANLVGGDLESDTLKDEVEELPPGFIVPGSN